MTEQEKTPTDTQYKYFRLPPRFQPIIFRTIYMYIPLDLYIFESIYNLDNLYTKTLPSLIRNC